MDAPNSNECKSATARSNCGATLGLHDVAKWTVPNFSSTAPCGCTCSCPYAANVGSVRRAAVAAIDARIMCAPWCLIVQRENADGKFARYRNDPYDALDATNRPRRTSDDFVLRDGDRGRGAARRAERPRRSHEDGVPAEPRRHRRTRAAAELAHAERPSRHDAERVSAPRRHRFPFAAAHTV